MNGCESLNTIGTHVPKGQQKARLQAAESPLAELAREARQGLGFSSILLCALDVVHLQRCVVKEMLPVCTPSSGKILHTSQDCRRALPCCSGGFQSQGSVRYLKYMETRW
jgi:hypothetical protein